MIHNSRAHQLHCCILAYLIHIGYNVRVSPGVVQYGNLDVINVICAHVPLPNLPSSLQKKKIKLIAHSTPICISEFSQVYFILKKRINNMCSGYFMSCKDILSNYYLIWKAQNRSGFLIFPKQRKFFCHKPFLNKCSHFLFTKKSPFLHQNK